MEFSLRCVILCIAALLTSNVYATELSDNNPLGKSDYVPLQAIVKFKKGSIVHAGLELERLQAVSDRIYLVENDVTSLVDRYGAVINLEVATQHMVERLRARDDVEYAHMNYLFSLSEQPVIQTNIKNLQWNLPAIQWGSICCFVTDPANIAVIDTGWTDHPDLAGTWVADFNSTNDPVAGPGPASAEDKGSWRHGTHVANILTSNGIGTNGVCPECSLMIVKATTDNPTTLTMDAILGGIDWAVGNGAQVINMSFEYNVSCSSPNMEGLRDVVENALLNGVHVVAAAGNQSQSAANFSPASCPGVISVAATDQQSMLASYSNHSAVTLAAPGGGGSLATSSSSGFGDGIGCPSDALSYFNPFALGVPSAWKTSPVSGDVNCYRYLSGTSMATPHVAATIGRMLTFDSSLTPLQAYYILTGTAQSLPGCGTSCGAGLLNHQAALIQAAYFGASYPTCSTDPNPPPGFCP